MQELEKILEEIELEKKRVSLSPDCSNEHAVTETILLEKIEKIIRKHMNDNNSCGECSRRKWYQIGYKDGKDDGWISVEERLPEEEYYPALCVTNENYYCVAVYNKTHGFRTGDICTVGEIVAWRPLPELYRPERSNNV